MSNVMQASVPAVGEGSGAGLIAFLGWTIAKNELVDATASALRTGCLKVLSVEETWESLDLRTADLDAIVSRFKNKHRMDMKDRTREQYEQRFRQSVEMYLKWLDDDPMWKPAQRRRAPAVNGAGGGNKSMPAEVAPATTQPQGRTKHDSSSGGMITYPFPVRPGLVGTIQLPEDLTGREAARVAAFIATLAVEGELEPDQQK